MIELKSFWGFNENRKQIGNKVDMITFDRKVREVSRTKKDCGVPVQFNSKRARRCSIDKKS